MVGDGNAELRRMITEGQLRMVVLWSLSALRKCSAGMPSYNFKRRNPSLHAELGWTIHRIFKRVLCIPAKVASCHDSGTVVSGLDLSLFDEAVFGQYSSFFWWPTFFLVKPCVCVALLTVCGFRCWVSLLFLLHWTGHLVLPGTQTFFWFYILVWLFWTWPLSGKYWYFWLFRKICLLLSASREFSFYGHHWFTPPFPLSISVHLDICHTRHFDPIDL